MAETVKQKKSDTVIKSDTVTLTLNDYNELLRRIEVVEKIIVYARRSALRDELSQLEDGMRLERTVKRRVR